MIDGQFVGVDVGGTKIAAAVMESGVLGDNHVVPTELSSSEALMEQLGSTLAGLVTAQTRAVGLAIPSVVDFATGTALYSVNVPLQGVAVRAPLEERLGVPVYVSNDGSCAALAEAYDGDELVASSLVMYTVGTGIGGGIVLNGRLYRSRTSATEVGHQVIGLDVTDGVPKPTGTDFPRTGSAEALVAGTELDRLALRFARAHPDSPLGRRLADDGAVEGPDVVEFAERGDDVALRAIGLLGERLGLLIANAINLLDPDEVVIGGGVSTAGELLLGPAREVSASYVMPGLGTSTTIRLARRGVEAGVAGAALLAAQELAEDEQGGPPPPA